MLIHGGLYGSSYHWNVENDGRLPFVLTAIGLECRAQWLTIVMH